ncbi:MAG TPA: T9SS type A sorting domain-containing protein, partial [Candidatus Kapabacteria bacterium]
IFRFSTYTTEVYSLPGKLPTSNTKLSVTDAPTIISGSTPSTSAYPNPSNGKIRVAYSLPEGVTTGELVITSTDGREVKRYRVGNMFNDILIEKSELASGAYFYKLTSERGESEARKFVITN